MFRPLVVAAAVMAAWRSRCRRFPSTVHVRVEGVTRDALRRRRRDSAHEVEGQDLRRHQRRCERRSGPDDDRGARRRRHRLGRHLVRQLRGLQRRPHRPGRGRPRDGRFWGLVLNGEATQVGGCQQRVEAGDEVLFAYDLFSKAHVLQLRSEQNVAAVGTGVVYEVRDAATGAPVAGATVSGKATDASGRVTLFYSSSGSHTVKAEKADSIRSNAFSTCVYLPPRAAAGSPLPPRRLAAPAERVPAAGGRGAELLGDHPRRRHAAGRQAEPDRAAGRPRRGTRRRRPGQTPGPRRERAPGHGHGRTRIALAASFRRGSRSGRHLRRDPTLRSRAGERRSRLTRPSWPGRPLRPGGRPATIVA